MVNSRTKGRGGEHETCGYLNDNVGSVLGCEFKRNLSQTQEAGQADIVCSNPNWEFEIEVKRYARDALTLKWWRQVKNAATRSGNIPVLWMRKDRHQPQVVMALSNVVEIFWGRSDEFDDFDGELITMNPSAFYKLAIEQSERTFHRDPNRQMAACQECGGSGTISKEIKDPTGFPFSVDVEVTCRACKGAGEV